MPTKTETTNTLDYLLAAQERTLSALKQSQSATVEAVETWAKAVESSVPEMPAIPVLESFPAPEEWIKNSFDFAAQLLTAQREFAQQVVKAAAPAMKTKPVEIPHTK